MEALCSRALLLMLLIFGFMSSNHLGAVTAVPLSQALTACTGQKRSVMLDWWCQRTKWESLLFSLTGAICHRAFSLLFVISKPDVLSLGFFVCFCFCFVLVLLAKFHWIYIRTLMDSIQDMVYCLVFLFLKLFFWLELNSCKAPSCYYISLCINLTITQPGGYTTKRD